MNSSRYLFVIALLFSLFACDVITWKEVPPEISQTAIANDGSDMAVVMRNYEINKAADKDPSNVFGASRNYEHQIFVQNQEGKKRRAITDKRPYKDDYPFYYVKTAGYILLGVMFKEDKNWTTRYEKIDLKSGKATTIRTQSTTPQHLICKDQSPQSFVVESVVPSTDGTIIAYFYSPSCFKAKVEFLDAKTLSTIDTKKIDIKGINEAIWLPNEGLILYSTTETEGNNAWKLLPKKSPISMHFIQ
jgi:hypothetical protein